jgi:hypothetical protein
MANVAFFNVYQINQSFLPRDQSQRIGFPTTGVVIISDCSGSPQRSLASGYNVYGVITVPSPAAADSGGTDYYVQETVAQIATIFG